MEDVDAKPPSSSLPSAANSDPPNIGTLDGWIEGLMSCKQLSETDVQRLCEKVNPSRTRMQCRCWVGGIRG